MLKRIVYTLVISSEVVNTIHRNFIVLVGRLSGSNSQVESSYCFITPNLSNLLFTPVANVSPYAF